MSFSNKVVPRMDISNHESGDWWRRGKPGSGHAEGPDGRVIIARILDKAWSRSYYGRGL